MVKLVKGKTPGYYHIKKGNLRVGYIKINENTRNTEIKINQKQRNKGYGTQALKKVSKKHKNLSAVIRKSNKQSIKMAEKAGFKKVNKKGQLKYIKR